MVPDGFNILALCAGGGGLELGIELALPSARTVCVVEREAFACEVLAQAHENHGLGAPLGWTDLHTFDGRPWREVVDCVAAGIPCQPHSVAGKRMGAGDERNLWPDAERIIRECEPPFVFLENVGGAVAFFGEHVVGGLEAMGYRVEAGLFSAAEVGAPHGRERLFVLAYREGGDRGLPTSGRRPRQARAHSSGSGEAVADAGCAERRKAAGGENSPARETVAGTERASTALADAEHVQARTGGAGIKGEPAGDGRRGSPDGGAELADAVGEHDDSAGHGAGAVCRERPQAPEVCEGVADVLPLFPPPPGINASAVAKALSTARSSGEARALAAAAIRFARRIAGDWKGVLRTRPDLAPAVESSVRTVADGLASRVDRISMLGNGVVPLAAAYAFATLLARLEHSLSAE